MNKGWRRGYTTGTCAAAAARAAVMVLRGISPPEGKIRVTLPRGEEVELPVTVSRGERWAEAVVIKDAGDDPDITHGAAIHVRARLVDKGITLRAGPGVGIVTKPGLPIPVGEPAINPVPRAMIKEAVKDFLPPDLGVELTISIPGGEELACRTLNPKLGIQGGLSILGTTGIVEPMSEEAFRASLIPQIEVARAAGLDTLVLTPGRQGQRQAVENYNIPAEAVILTSNFIGFIAEACVERHMKRLLLWGYIGKLVKVAGGIFHTHSRLADARREIVGVWAAAWGAPPRVVKAVLEANTVETVLTILEEAWGREFCRTFWNHMAGLASSRLKERLQDKVEVGTAFLNLKGQIVGWDEKARQILGEWGYDTKQGELA